MKPTINELTSLCAKQLDNFFEFHEETEYSILKNGVSLAINKTIVNFQNNKNKYYSENFNPFHSGQYSVFLYYLSNSIWKLGSNELADKIYYLNKALNAVDLFYQIELPNIFALDHSVGTVLGRAKHSDYLVFSQNITVGNNNNIFPKLDKKLAIMSGATIIGNSHIGENCIISANTFIKDTDIPSFSIVFGSSPNLTIKSKPTEYFNDFFNSRFNLL